MQTTVFAEDTHNLSLFNGVTAFLRSTTVLTWQKSLAVAGVCVLALGLLSISSLFFLWPRDLRPWTLLLRPSDSHVDKDPVEWAGPIPQGHSSPCKVVLVEGKKEIEINESFRLTVIVTPRSALTCRDHISIYAPAFDVKPESQEFELPYKQGHQAKT